MKTLRARLLLFTTIATASVLIAAGLAVYFVNRASLYAQFDSGLVEETRALAEDARAASRLEMVMGYREALLHLRGTVRLDEAIRLTIRAQRDYAKRQRTWFRAEQQWQWLQTRNPQHVAVMVAERLVH